ncbi:MAG: hypothetical protein ACPHW5_02005 [Candidatus Puniceispirillales bacterium]
MLRLLEWLGRHAMLVLPAGIVVAMMLPETDAPITLIVPPLIAMIYTVTFIRMDLPALLRDMLTPIEILRQLLIAGFILIIMPLLLIGGCVLAGVDMALLPSATWYAVAPPIASTAWICGIMGLSLPTAMRVIVMTSLLAPFTGPFMAGLILPNAVSISSLTMFFNLAAMIFAGVILALIGQMILGKAKIERHSRRFDGLAAITMLVFLIPVFNGIPRQMFNLPVLAGKLLLLAMILNFSTQLILMLVARLSPVRHGRNLASVLAVLSGNRNVGLYYGALPVDPIFGMFTALYQVPLYLTPLLMSRVRRLMGLV